MESFLKKFGDMAPMEAFTTMSASEYKSLVIENCVKYKIGSMRQLFNLLLADDADWIPERLCGKLRNPIFITQWIKEIESRHNNDETKTLPLPLSLPLPLPLLQYETSRPIIQEEETCLLASDLMHLPTFTKQTPSANISFIIQPAFENLGFSFSKDGSDFYLLWNIIMMFAEIQAAILQPFQIEPFPNQIHAPKDTMHFGSLSDFLSIDFSKTKMNKKWEDPVGEMGFSFASRPWKFYFFGEEKVLFEENNLTQASLFERLLIFGAKNKQITLQTIELFQWNEDTKPSSIVLLCFDLILSVLFGKQIKLHPKYQPLSFQSFHCSKVPKLAIYFFDLMSFRPISVSVEHFKSTQMFGEIVPDALAHPFSKKTCIWIQKKTKDMLDNEYKLLIFPKHSSKKKSIITTTITTELFQRPEAFKNRILCGLKNNIFSPVCKLKDDTLVAINTQDGYIYRTLIPSPLSTNIWLCLLAEDNVDLKSIINLAKIWSDKKPNLILISKNAQELKELTDDNDDDDILISCNDKIQNNSKHRKIIITNRIEGWGNEIGLIFLVANYHVFDPPPQHGYVIVVSKKNELNWIAIQSMFVKTNSMLKTSISFSQAIQDRCLLYVEFFKKSKFTKEREEQDIEYQKLLKQQATTTIVRKRPCENSRLLIPFMKKK